MNKRALVSHLERIDAALARKATLCVYGSAACILLDEPDRTSRVIDVAAPYSDVDYGDLERAAQKAGLPVNPGEDSSSDHIEWISSLRPCLPKPSAETEVVLWKGSKLTVKTVSLPELVASKLIRYDEIDRGDIEYLCAQAGLEFSRIRNAAKSLPPPFHRDPVVLDNVANLEADLAMWRGDAE